MQTLSYTELETPFLNQVRQFETTEWKAKQEYIHKLQKDIESLEKSQNEQQKYISELEQKYAELVERKQQDDNTMKQTNQNQQLLLENQLNENQQLMDEIRQLQIIHQSDQEMIINLQNQLNQSNQPNQPNQTSDLSKWNQPIVVPPRDDCSHDQLVKSYMEQIIQHLKKKENV